MKKSCGTKKFTTYAYYKLLLFLIYGILRRVESLFFKIKYGNCRILKDGKGALTKYIIKKNGKEYLIKKTNFLINHFTAIFVKEPLLKDKHIYMNKIIHEKFFSDITLCKEVLEDRIIYQFEPTAQQFNLASYDKKEFKKLICGIKQLHEKGYYLKDFVPSNILVLKKNKKIKYLLIDIDRMEPITKPSEKKFEFDLFLNSFEKQMSREGISYAKRTCALSEINNIIHETVK